MIELSGELSMWARIFIFFVILFFQRHFVAAFQPPLDSTKELISQDGDLEISNLMNSMTLEQKVGQLFLIGFQGEEVTDGLAQIIREVRPGGIILFGRNIKTARQTARLIYQAQITSMEATKIPLLVAVDQEGGVVSRIKLKPPFPSAMAIGLTGSTEISERMGYYTGVLLRALGFNMNLAPVVDIISGQNPTFIGNRAFALDPNLSSVMAEAFSNGQQLAGIVSTYKHFPGHGNSFTDSHLSLPMRFDSLEEILKRDLLPYYGLSTSRHPTAVMVAHIAFPNVDPSRLPATYSKIFLDDILRKRLKFNGIVITDDIEMAGANVNTSLGERAVKSLQAGADMVMVAWNRAAQKSCVAAVISAVREGLISEDKLNSSLRRILITKRNLGILSQPPLPNFRSYRSLILSRSIADLSEKILEISMTRSFLQLQQSVPPPNPPSFVAVVSTRKAFHSYMKLAFHGRLQHLGFSQFRAGTLTETLYKHKNAMALIHVTSRQVAEILNRHPQSLKNRMFVVNADSPGMIEVPESYKHIFNVYTPDSRAGKFIGAILRSYYHLTPASNSVRLPANDSVDTRRNDNAGKIRSRGSVQ